MHHVKATHRFWLSIGLFKISWEKLLWKYNYWWENYSIFILSIGLGKIRVIESYTEVILDGKHKEEAMAIWCWPFLPGKENVYKLTKNKEYWTLYVANTSHAETRDRPFTNSEQELERDISMDKHVHKLNMQCFMMNNKEEGEQFPD